MEEKKKDRSSCCHWSFKTAQDVLDCPSSTSYNLNQNIRLLSLYLTTMIGYQEVSLMSEIIIKLILLKFKNFLVYLIYDDKIGV